MAVARPRLLVTAGNTFAPIDAVRGITNVFTGRTGARIAAQSTMDGYDTELLTSQPDVIEDTTVDFTWLTLTTYRTFDDLAALLETRVRHGGYDVIVHAAAVSDYRVAGVFEPTTPLPISDDAPPATVPFRRIETTLKMSSGHSDLWLRLTPTPKLIDQIRRPWGFDGVLVKFKLEVAVSDAELARRAQFAQQQSDADLVVANTLESMSSAALFVTAHEVETVQRSRLPANLLARITELRRLRASAS